MNFTPPHTEAIRLNNNTLSTARDSNIELLRLVAMFGIVLLHLVINGSHFYSATATTQEHIVANTLVGFLYVGVNCFILISGYFGVTFRWRSLINLYLVCFFYELVGFAVAYYTQADFQFQLSYLGELLFPLSHSHLWYIRCYIVLLFLSPLINPSLQSFDKKQYQHILILLTILNLYFGWFWKHTDFNGNGYNISQFIYLYVIGGYLHRYCSADWVRNHRYLFLCGFVGLSVLWGITQNIHDLVHTVPHWNGWSYSNPVVILSAICLFLFFTTIDIQGKAINWLAKGTLAVYIFHCNPYIETVLYRYSNQLTNNTPISLMIVRLILEALVILLTICIIDRLRGFISLSTSSPTREG